MIIIFIFLDNNIYLKKQTLSLTKILVRLNLPSKQCISDLIYFELVMGSRQTLSTPVDVSTRGMMNKIHVPRGNRLLELMANQVVVCITFYMKIRKLGNTLRAISSAFITPNQMRERVKRCEGAFAVVTPKYRLVLPQIFYDGRNLDSLIHPSKQGRVKRIDYKGVMSVKESKTLHQL